MSGAIMSGRVLFFAGAAAAAWGLLTWLTGGFTLALGPIAMSSRSVVRALAAAAVLLAASRAVLSREDFGRCVRGVLGGSDGAPARFAAAATVAVFIAAAAWNTRAAGGSDSSCYILQAEAFAHGEILLREPLALGAPFKDAGAVFAPTGWVQAPTERAAAAPICAPGLALMMTPALMVGGHTALTLVVPLFAALAVWSTFVLGRRLDEAWTGAIAALLLACSPIFLYQAVQPMSDVPAAALWIAALVLCLRNDRVGDVTAGISAGLAVLTRPNLIVSVLPLAAIFVFDRAATRRSPLARLSWFAAAALPCILVLAWMNLKRYGFPLASGYGDTGQLFALSHVWPNLGRYSRWLVSTETPFILLGLASPWWAWRARRGDAIAITTVSLVSAVLLVLTYLAYVVFDDWWYIRFLLPALPVLLVFSVTIARALLGPIAMPVRAIVVAALAGALAVWYLQAARTRDVFALQAIESRFLVTGAYSARALPADAVVLAVQQSASIRYHGGRSTMVWDAVDPGGLDAAIAWLKHSGRRPFVAVEDQEEERFRRRFARQRYGALDWPPMAEIHARVRVRLYDIEGRQRYLDGGVMPTEHIR